MISLPSSCDSSLCELFPSTRWLEGILRHRKALHQHWSRRMGSPRSPEKQTSYCKNSNIFNSHWNNLQKKARVCIVNLKRMTAWQNIHSELTKCPGNKTSYQVLTKANSLLPYDSAIALLVLHPKKLKSYVHMKICSWECIATFFTIA